MASVRISPQRRQALVSLDGDDMWSFADELADVLATDDPATLGAGDPVTYLRSVMDGVDAIYALRPNPHDGIAEVADPDPVRVSVSVRRQLERAHAWMELVAAMRQTGQVQLAQRAVNPQVRLSSRTGRYRVTFSPADTRRVVRFLGPLGRYLDPVAEATLVGTFSAVGAVASLQPARLEQEWLRGQAWTSLFELALPRVANAFLEEAGATLAA